MQDAADGGLVLGDDAVVAGEAGGLLGDHAEAGRVMVAPGDERGARRRAERGGVDVVVAQTVLRDAIHRRRRNDAAEGARHAEAGVVGHDEQDVGRALGRHDARRPPRFRLQGVVLDHAAEFRVRRRELLAADAFCGAGRAEHASDLLGHDRHGCQHGDSWRRSKRRLKVFFSSFPYLLVFDYNVTIACSKKTFQLYSIWNSGTHKVPFLIDGVRELRS